MNKNNIRNFSIIAHIDHGKSTLADRILEKTEAISKRELKDQMLDSMDIERERGITIKLNAVQITYKYKDSEYYLNLIDTPGHVDFTYEVSRSLAACEGCLLIVDATQGVEAQTLANLYLALDNNLTVLPVINKIDLPSADVDRVLTELSNIGFDKDKVSLVSAKTGEGVDLLLQKIITDIPSPKLNKENNLKALIFDSIYDSYKGVVLSIRVFSGSIKVGDIIKMMSTNAKYEVLSLSIKTPKEKDVKELSYGDVGYLYASIKSISDINVGDTITHFESPADEALPGYKKMKAFVYSGIYPNDTSKYELLRESLEKLKLNDAALEFEPEVSTSLGFGFRCGFLGLLHMDVTLERIKREFNIELIATAPSVIYKVIKTNNEEIEVSTPIKMPNKELIKTIKEPYVKASIFTPNDYVGSIMELCQEKRGIFINMDYIDDKRLTINYEIPLSEIVYSFFDKLKSTTKGYASFDYEIIGYKEANLVKMDILLNGDIVDAFSLIVHKDFAYTRGRSIVEKLKEVIPRQMFEVPIQASIGNKVIARETIRALRKDVLAKCYGGDITRKKKLLEKQKAGKKKMKSLGSVDVPPDAFLSILKSEK